MKKSLIWFILIGILLFIGVVIFLIIKFDLLQTIVPSSISSVTDSGMGGGGSI
jgi:type IV secretory pathway TrbL component